MQTKSQPPGLAEYWRKVKAGEIQPVKPGAPQKVTRQVRLISTWARTGRLYVTVHDHGELSLREPGRRATYRIGMPEVYRQAVLITAGKIRARAAELRKAGASRRSAARMARREILY